MVENPSITKPHEGAGLWLFKIVSGLLIIALLFLHFIVNHFLAPQGLLSWAEVIAYYNIPIIPAIEIFFLIFVVAHSLVGLRSIILDLNPSKAVTRVMDIGFWALGTVAIVYGIWLALRIAAIG